MLHENRESVHFLTRAMEINNAGNKTRLVTVAVIRVREVSHPNAFVPPNPLKQNIINPAIKTMEVYIILIPVW